MPGVDQLVRLAITQRRVVRFVYQGKERIAEPHDYGIQNGVRRLLAYQIGGRSSGLLPNWRWVDTDRISELELLERTFPGGRQAPSGKHHKWDELFVRVKPADDGTKR